MALRSYANQADGRGRGVDVYDRVLDHVSACVDTASFGDEAVDVPADFRKDQRRLAAAESVDALPVLQLRLPGTRANRTVMDRPPSGRALVLRAAW
jgi:hypothetical protein